MKLIPQFLAVIDAYRKVALVSDATVSNKIYHDGGRIKGLRHGRDMQSRTIERGLQWLSDEWPEGAVWPDQVPRPDPTPSEPELPTPPES